MQPSLDYAIPFDGKLLHASERRELVDAKRLGQLIAIGVPLIVGLVMAPVLLRYAFGTLSGELVLSNGVSIVLMALFGLSTVAFVFRMLVLRGWPLLRAGLLACMAAAPTMVLTYLAMLATQSIFPAFCILDPREPRTISFHVLTALADSLPFVAAWGTFLFLPPLWRMQIQKRAELAHAEREAELLRLRSHLEPHFVLNTMNAISGLVTEDPEQARELLGMLGDIFRDATSLSEQHALRDELAWLRRYVDIHTLRFPERLAVSWQVDAALLDCKIPALLVQPLVENALMHGALLSRSGKLRIEVAVHAPAAGPRQLRFQIADNGPRLGGARPGGKGLSLVRRRLVLHGYAEDALALTRAGAETLATLTLALPEVLHER